MLGLDETGEFYLVDKMRGRSLFIEYVPVDAYVPPAPPPLKGRKRSGGQRGPAISHEQVRHIRRMWNAGVENKSQIMRTTNKQFGTALSFGAVNQIIIGRTYQYVLDFDE